MVRHLELTSLRLRISVINCIYLKQFFYFIRVDGQKWGINIVLLLPSERHMK